jgi:hypothetical protein
VLALVEPAGVEAVAGEAAPFRAGFTGSAIAAADEDESVEAAVAAEADDEAATLGLMAAAGALEGVPETARLSKASSRDASREIPETGLLGEADWESEREGCHWGL